MRFTGEKALTQGALARRPDARLAFAHEPLPWVRLGRPPHSWVPLLEHRRETGGSHELQEPFHVWLENPSGEKRESVQPGRRDGHGESAPP